MIAFREAVEERDLDRVSSLLAEDIVFRSPIAFKPYQGRQTVAALLRTVARVFADFVYVREIGTADASDHALVFKARVDDREIEGCDFLHTNAEGLVDELVVMVRPLSGALALAEAMKAQLARAEDGIATG